MLKEPVPLEAGEMLGGRFDDVSFALRLGDLGDTAAVRRVQVTERMNSLPTCTIEAVCNGARPDPHELLGKDCALVIERVSQERAFKGIVARAHVDEDHEGMHLTLDVVPALWMLSRQRDSRIFQDKEVAEVVEEIVQRRLGGRSRRIQKELSDTYEKHEYLVQYQESDFAFIARLLEREGIFFFFDHEDDHEVLVLSDSVASLKPVHGNGRVPFWKDPLQAPDHEAVSYVTKDEVVGPTQAVLTGFDWTNPTLSVHGEKKVDTAQEMALEVYDHHTQGVTYHRYESRQYKENTVRKRAESRAAALEQGRKGWNLGSTVVTASPGRVIEVVGAPDPSLDDRYLIIGSYGTGSAAPGTTGSWSCDCTVLPTTMTYRPPARASQPIAHLETATVVGPSGQEIHTDEHGRIKVQFHWDRQGQRDERSSCWIRVMQSWSGPGYGTFFLPRIGMEVAVSFLGGDPDRPMVIGCLYNGQNHSPANPLPDKKTHSVIRTKSSLHSDGFNELRFEDDAGSERIYVHAQRDLIQDVLHDRDVDVGNDERLLVKGDRSRKVEGKEQVEVCGERRKLQRADELEMFEAKFESHYQDKRTELYAAPHIETLSDERRVRYDGSGEFTHKVEYTQAGELREFLGGNAYCVTKIGSGGVWRVHDLGERAVWMEAKAEGYAGIAAKTSIGLNTFDCSSRLTLRQHRIIMGSDKIKIQGEEQIKLQVGGSSITIDPAGITLRAAGNTLLIGPGGIMMTSSAGVIITAGPAFVVSGGVITRGGKVLWD